MGRRVPSGTLEDTNQSEAMPIVRGGGIMITWALAWAAVQLQNPEMMLFTFFTGAFDMMMIISIFDGKEESS